MTTVLLVVIGILVAAITGLFWLFNKVLPRWDF